MNPHIRQLHRRLRLRVVTMLVTFTVPGAPVPKARARIVTAAEPTPQLRPRDTRRRSPRRHSKPWGAGRPSRLADGWMADLTFDIPIPKSWTRKRKELMAEEGHTQKPDLDNYVKTILDACNGVVYEDDSQITCITAMKSWAPEGYDGGTTDARTRQGNAEQTVSLVQVGRLMFSQRLAEHHPDHDTDQDADEERRRVVADVRDGVLRLEQGPVVEVSEVL